MKRIQAHISSLVRARDLEKSYSSYKENIQGQHYFKTGRKSYLENQCCEYALFFGGFRSKIDGAPAPEGFNSENITVCKMESLKIKLN
jgi:hypothetical protein